MQRRQFIVAQIQGVGNQENLWQRLARVAGRKIVTGGKKNEQQRTNDSLHAQHFYKAFNILDVPDDKQYKQHQPAD